jgi:hypothetical protein
MKLRFNGDSIRLRLSVNEVAQLAATGSVRSQTAFTFSSALVYQLIADEDQSQTAVTFHAGEIRIALPLKVVQSWANGQDVGIYTNQPIAGDRQLKITIEKDFECMHPTGEISADALYPNPRQDSR